ncbi:GATA zinc finger domain-containing protein 21-like [Drosophila sulfurigaster albostrigata]|uniref:GATA zinc finger domain-containing protein 21-like n=1 Tax=Drosophila sulfurigaster albostrigata TaxID=89887 RepID=UPI002D21EC7F|nr:GATA zinc finger domain-containing protein 21-like [Drosophila sulfurigaster albostrigata]
MQMESELELEMENENENEKASISNEKYNNNNNSNSNNNGNTGHNASSSNRGTMWRPWPLNTTDVSLRRLFPKVRHVLPGFILLSYLGIGAHTTVRRTREDKRSRNSSKSTKSSNCAELGAL